MNFFSFNFPLLCRGSPRYCFLKWQLQEVARSSVGFIMLRLARLVSQFPSQYFSKLPGFNFWKLIWFSGVFPPMGGHIIQKWYECSINDQDRDRYDWGFRSVVENEDLYGWDYRLINENHDRYYLNRVCILETQSLWSKERSVMSSEDLKDWKEEVSIGDPECQMQRLKLSILAVTIKENWKQVGINHVPYIE